MNEPKKYRKKPVVIEAIQYLEKENWEAVQNFLCSAYDPDPPKLLFCNTLEGRMLVSPGDYIIRGIQGELYPCKPDIFEATYEVVENE